MSSPIAVQIPVLPWFQDHSFNGKVIFPAVEAMLLLAGVANTLDVNVHLQSMFHARFSKLLEIPEGVNELTALVEYEKNGDELSLKLLSKIQFKKISRIKEHAEIRFSTNSQDIFPVQQEKNRGNSIAIDAARIYQDFVPFGPTYRTITDTLYITKTSAHATLQAPIVSQKQEMEAIIGSPFPMDGAMHAACVLGQCIADFVPFPVGFDQRLIHQPTQAGDTYHCTVILVAQTANELLFDCSIFDKKGNACETIKALRMRDVTGGMIKPAADLPNLKAFP